MDFLLTTVLNNQGVVGLHRDVLAAAAADADQHLSIRTPVALAYSCVDCPRQSEVESAYRSADQM